MIILGIDQGLAHLGYAVIDVTDKTINLLDYGCLLSHPGNDPAERIFELINNLEKIILLHNPINIAHERLFFSPPAKNSRKKSASILNTNMVTGAIWYIAGKHSIKVSEYSPQTVKKTLCGDGRAEKEKIITYIEGLFDIECTKTKKEHICDAIAIGMTHITKNNIQQILGEQEKEVD